MRFSVDTQLFRQLGEYLVGRDSTALAELVKNSYDADASKVSIYGESLDNPEDGFIEILDDGVGMTRADFEEGFLRIASRSKLHGERRSVLYGRRYTGEKGIGRLAAQKLARHLTIESTPHPCKAGSNNYAIRAEIDWDRIEESELLEQVGEDALTVEVIRLERPTPSGTRIRLSRLRRKWTESARARFISEVRSYDPPSILFGSIRGLPDGMPQLLQVLVNRDGQQSDPGFSIDLHGEFEQGDEIWDEVAESANWLLEIDACGGPSQIRYRITPTLKTLRDRPHAEQREVRVAKKTEAADLMFQARILVREGPRPSSVRGARSDQYYGIRLFLEGFRTLPYGERGNDWLQLDAEYSERARRIEALNESAFPDLLNELASDDEGLIGVPSQNYTGGVFLTHRGASALRMVVNREGFERNEQFDSLVETVRLGLGLLTRTRAHYVAMEGGTSGKRSAKASQGIPDKRRVPTLAEKVEEAIARTRSDAQEAEHLVKKGETSEAGQVLIKSAQNLQTFVHESSETLRDQTGMIRVLASIGLQMGSFVHEIRSAVGHAKMLNQRTEELRRHEQLPATIRRLVSRLVHLAEELHRSLEWLSASLDEVATVDKRRRRSRQVLRAAFDEASNFVRSSAAKKSVELVNDIPAGLRTPPLFANELFAVLLNVVSNAVKFAGKSGKVYATASLGKDGKTRLRIENTGERVLVGESDKLFRPFESTTTQPDAVLGQGMGLGLQVTRNMLEERGAEIAFTEPSDGFQTAIEICFAK